MCCVLLRCLRHTSDSHSVSTLQRQHRSTGTLQIPRRPHQGIEFEAVCIRSSPPPSFGTRILDGNLENNDPAAQHAFARTRLQSCPWLILGLSRPSGSGRSRSPQDRAGTGTGTYAHIQAPQSSLALGYFPQPRVRISPKPAAFDDSDPRSWALFRVGQDPEVCCKLHPCSGLQQHGSTGTAVAPLNGSQKSA